MREPVAELLRHECLGLSRLPLLDRFPDAKHERQFGAGRGKTFLRALGIGFSEDVSSFRVAYEHNPSAGVFGHRRRDLSGEGALLCPMNVLHAGEDVGPAGCGDGDRRSLASLSAPMRQGTSL